MRTLRSQPHVDILYHIVPRPSPDPRARGGPEGSAAARGGPPSQLEASSSQAILVWTILVGRLGVARPARAARVAGAARLPAKAARRRRAERGRQPDSRAAGYYAIT